MKPQNKTAHTAHEIEDIFAERWSPRSFADTPVEPEKIRRMLEAARWTMSSFNAQPWRYFVATKDMSEEYEQMLSCLMDANAAWAQNAPVLMISVMKTYAQDDLEKENKVAQHDLGAASAALTFQAMAMDLYVHQMAGIKHDRIKEVYNLPEGFEPVAGLAIGYLGEVEQLSEDLQERETKERSRKPQSEWVFTGEFGETSPLVEE